MTPGRVEVTRLDKPCGPRSEPGHGSQIRASGLVPPPKAAQPAQVLLTFCRSRDMKRDGVGSVSRGGLWQSIVLNNGLEPRLGRCSSAGDPGRPESPRHENASPFTLSCVPSCCYGAEAAWSTGFACRASRPRRVAPVGPRLSLTHHLAPTSGAGREDRRRPATPQRQQVGPEIAPRRTWADITSYLRQCRAHRCVIVRG
jgi:hypothetical protein